MLIGIPTRRDASTRKWFDLITCVFISRVAPIEVFLHSAWPGRCLLVINALRSLADAGGLMMVRISASVMPLPRMSASTAGTSPICRLRPEPAGGRDCAPPRPPPSPRPRPPSRPALRPPPSRPPPSRPPRP
jgi:hypothetical protein